MLLKDRTQPNNWKIPSNKEREIENTGSDIYY